MSNPALSIQTYLRAKDENRPHLMKAAFAASARLEVTSKSDVISFPPVTTGLEAITQVLVRDFGRTYENVYTFCLSDEPQQTAGRFKCRWIVGMSDKATGSVRVGCGDYDWSFQRAQPALAEALVISIATMKALPPETLAPVMAWLSGLPYPWCPAAVALETMPGLAELAEIRAFVKQAA
ncbi:hypothetical protein [Bradyrhizobium sp. NP1]|uniref:hypothetical protein n=1 Tax=Bradyrhizobium sp. NP1 TaxID=3049772 RepID=UPI0025A55DE7|nr:hypothetical protein [Bradyrhizobium sp. NP1]WJR74904.1 hypothetical protein QOU61_18930 [Bradyrhizobium sp. NP1]